MAEGGVEFYSGVQYAERPAALTWQGKRYEVEEVERSWRTPEASCWLVRTKGDQRFRVSYSWVWDQELIAVEPYHDPDD